jgi:cytochrome b6-f complex iron-sulfur subunit
MADPTTTPDTTPKPAAPAAPKPAAKAPAKPGKDRRGFLSWAAVGWVSLVAALLGLGGGLQRFLYPNVLSEPPSKFKAGFPDSYEEGKVNERFKDQNAWIIRDRDAKGRSFMYALSTTCTHLGCTPNWLEREEKFKCPCHGSGFYKSGINFEGPAPRPLERWAISLGDDGQVIVDKSQKFQFEQGKWDDPNSYILV